MSWRIETAAWPKFAPIKSLVVEASYSHNETAARKRNVYQRVDDICDHITAWIHPRVCMTTAVLAYNVWYAEWNGNRVLDLSYPTPIVYVFHQYFVASLSCAQFSTRAEVPDPFLAVLGPSAYGPPLFFSFSVTAPFISYEILISFSLFSDFCLCNKRHVIQVSLLWLVYALLPREFGFRWR